MTPPVLIGRDHPAGVLRTQIRRATDSHGGLVLVTGEAGIGKTSLATDAADEARGLGALVLGGTCWDSDSAPGYWPWVQVLRGLRRGIEPGEWAEAERSAGGLLAVLLGEEPDGSGGRDSVREGKESFALYDAVTTALVTASQRRPVVVVLDDLHWADPASLRLLAFVAQHAWFERLLLVGTYRDVEVEAPGHPLQELVLPLASRAAATVTLTGLERTEVGALISLIAGVDPDSALVDEVYRRTGGNPFFVEQTARIWRGGGPVTTVAPGVREAVRRRLALLPEPVGGLLETAAVLGREFHRRLLAATAAQPVPHVDRLLQRATAARLVTTGTGGAFTFAHDLVRETLYDALDEPRRRALHADVVRAVSETPALGERIFPADLARHASLAGDAVARDRRVELLLAAARDAGGRLAEEEAVTHYRRAIDIAGDDHRRVAMILLDLGAELWHRGDGEEAWRSFDRAVRLARQIRDPALLARVAITLHRHGSYPGREARDNDLLREAHRALIGGGGEDPTGLSPQRIAQDLAVVSTELARDGADDDALAFALWARHDTIWGLGTSAERLRLTDEMIDVAQRTGDLGMELHAQSMRWVTLLELDDPRYYEQLRTFTSLAGHTGLRRQELSVSIDRSMVASFRGRFQEAADLMSEVTTVGYEQTPFGYMAAHMVWALALLQGRFADAERVSSEVAGAAHPYPDLLMGLTAVEQGDTPRALRHSDELVALEPLPRVFEPMAMRLRAQVAAASGDRDRIDSASAALSPHSGQWVVSLFGCDIGGPVDLWLGLLSAAGGDRESAVAELTSAADSADRLGARPWSLRARAALLRVLERSPGGAPAHLVAGVRRDAQSLGMTHLSDGGPEPVPPPSAPGSPALPSVAARPEPAAPATAVDRTPPRHLKGEGTAGEQGRPEAQFRKEGAVWALDFAGRSVHVPDAKGLRDLHTLLGHAGDDLSAVSLLDPEGGAVVVAARGLGGDPVLDEEAKTRYRRRLERLDEEIDRAAELDDQRRVEEFSRERAALLDELRTAAGLGGRTRRLGDEAERARKAVTARIRDSLRRLEGLHPELAAHLRESLTTGAYCSYRPARPVTWRL
ncbi:ATP-binding protein [Streptomyces sp. NPDC057638]|uniref:ATP-binding protein n=1 Tax=Streptomyces sp. NPDC057638 TaxID=3346190 RepID=UPI00368AFC89